MDRAVLIDALSAWLPFIVLVGVSFWLMRRSMKSYAAHIDEVGRINRESQEVSREAQAINREVLDLNRQMLAELREIKNALKDRKS
ncbi:MAG: hypothetical protein ACRCS0_16140 [Albidovulum sp.]